MKKLIIAISLLLCSFCKGQLKDSLMQEELSNAFETIKFIVEQKGNWFYSGEKYLSIEGKEIRHSIGTNTILIRNVYPTTSEGLQGDVNIIEYYIKKNTSSHITFWKNDSPIKPSNEILSDFIQVAKQLRHYTFDHIYLEPNQPITRNGLVLKLQSVAKDSSIIEVSFKGETDILTFSKITLYKSFFEGFNIYWNDPNSTTHKPKYEVIKKHELTVWNYFLGSIFKPNVQEAEKRMKAVYEVANKWEIPINVQFIVSSLSHDIEMQKDKFKPIIKQNQNIFLAFEKHFGKDWKKRFEKEVEEIMIQ